MRLEPDDIRHSNHVENADINYLQFAYNQLCYMEDCDKDAKEVLNLYKKSLEDLGFSISATLDSLGENWNCNDL
jgi:hypothetical protein